MKKIEKTQRNQNVLAAQCSGIGGKESAFLPQLLEFDGSYVVSDMDGSLYAQTAQLFRDKGYEVKVLDFAHPERSGRYNPFVYVRDDIDALLFASTLVENFSLDSPVAADAELRDLQLVLLHAVILFLHHECVPSERTLANVLRLAEAANERYQHEDRFSLLDIVFEGLEKKNPDHIALHVYRPFMWATNEEMLQKIVADIRENLSVLLNPNVAMCMADDNMVLGDIGLKPSVLYLSVRSKVIAPVLLMQLVDTLYCVAVAKFKPPHLPIRVRILVDDCGTIPESEAMLRELDELNKLRS